MGFNSGFKALIYWLTNVIKDILRYRSWIWCECCVWPCLCLM